MLNKVADGLNEQIKFFLVLPQIRRQACTSSTIILRAFISDSGNPHQDLMSGLNTNGFRVI